MPSSTHNHVPLAKLKIKILAPSYAALPSCFSIVNTGRGEHARVLRAVQRLRGDVYREYTPVANRLTSDGRHCQDIDPESWHILLEDEHGKLAGCSRLRMIEYGFDQLCASDSVLASSQKYGPLLRRSIEDKIAVARRQNIQYGEAGAWALRPEVRCSTAAINVVLMTYALSQKLGSGMGITTATTRHGSASILRRLGGSSLNGLPAYYDPAYGCAIEIVHFDVADLKGQYRAKVNNLAASLRDVEIICPSAYEAREEVLTIPEPFQFGISNSSASLALR